MQFLKRHYEKIILAALLVLFILSLIYLIQIFETTNNVTKAELNIPTREPDYQPINFKAPEFLQEAIFVDGTIWKDYGPRGQDCKVYTDFLIPFKIARCPHCGRLVPEYNFINAPNKCPICSGNLPVPQRRTSTTVSGGARMVNGMMDSDGDGIPDADEEKYGMNPKDPEDGEEDMDKDGFPNSFEYKMKTMLDNAKSHPPYFMRLTLDSLRKTLLDVTLKKVIQQGDQYDIQLNLENGAKTKFFTLNEKAKLEKNREYEITKISPKFIKSKQGNVVIEKDESQVTFTSLPDGKYTIEMKTGEPVYSPNPRAFVFDEGNGDVLELDEGDTFKIGSERAGYSFYKVNKIDIENENVEIIDPKTKKKISDITKKAKMPQTKRRVSKDGQPGAPPTPPDAGMPPGAPPSSAVPKIN